MPSGQRGWSKEQINNARIIAGVGRSMGMSSRDILISLMTAMQESGLRNLNYGDRDSLGLFQQRPSAGWGSRAQVTNPRYAAKKFFQSLSRIGNRNNIELWRAAQKVQISAFPRAYAKHEASMRALMGKLGSIEPVSQKGSLAQFGSFEPLETQVYGVPLDPTATPGVDNSPLSSAMDKLLQDGLGDDQDMSDGTESPEALGVGSADEDIDWSQWSPQQALMDEMDPQQFKSFASTFGAAGGIASATGSGPRSGVINMAKKFVGTPYVWGGTTPNGFDCSGFLQYAFKKMGIRIPRLAYQQARFGRQTSLKNITAGDLVFWGNSKRSQGNHIALYLGNGMIIEAPRPGLSVRIRKLRRGERAIGVQMNY